jgi:hypothetical protein
MLVPGSSEGGIAMEGKSLRVVVLAIVCGLVVVCGGRSEDVKPTDEGKAAEFKGKSFDIKEKGEAAILLAFEAGTRVTVTVTSDKKSDVNLFVYDAAKKQIAKDDSPGPNCELSFTPKEDGKLTLVVRNQGPGENRSTLRVRIAKAIKD